MHTASTPNAGGRNGSRLAMSMVALVAVVGLALTGCKSKDDSAAPQSGAQQTNTGETCTKVGSVKFAKTKFLLNGGLAFGAFHRYLYKPYKAGSFKSGADGRVKALIKGGLAAAFVANEVRLVKKYAEADKTLCKLVAPLDKASGALTGLVGKLKSGKADDNDLGQLDSVSGALDSFKSDASKEGTNIKDAPVPEKLLNGGGNK